MATNIVPRWFWSFPSLQAPSLFDEDDDMNMVASSPSGLSISEDDKHVYITAALPGVDPKDIEVTFDKGVMWVKGESKEEEKEGKKFYRRATSSFSYRIAVPGELDHTVEPSATHKHGVMTVAFTKSPAMQPKKISIKAEK